MAIIHSSTTINLESSLTEVGRKYLFGVDEKTRTQIRFDEQGRDLFLPMNFSVYDSDVNYRATTQLSSGEVPDLKGSGSTNGLFSCANSKRKNFIVGYQGFFPNISFEKTKYSLKEGVGNKIKLNINLDQYFAGYNGNGQTKFLLYVDPNETTFQNFTIDGASNMTIDSVDYYGIVYEPLFGLKQQYATINILSSETITEDQQVSINLKLKTISSCDIGLIQETDVVVLGTIPPLRNISFETNQIEVENKDANGTVETYVNLLLSELDYKKLKRVDVEVLFGPFLGPIALSPISIEVMQPSTQSVLNVDQTQLMYSKDYVATFVENKKPLPISFDKNKDKVSFRIRKPLITNIQDISETEDQITLLQTQLGTLSTTFNQLMGQIGGLNNTKSFITQSKNSSQAIVNQLNSELAVIQSDQQTAQAISTNIDAYISNGTLLSSLADKYGKLSDYNTIVTNGTLSLVQKKATLQVLFGELALNEIQGAINAKVSQVTAETSNLNSLIAQIDALNVSIAEIQTQISNLNYSQNTAALSIQIGQFTSLVNSSILGNSIHFKIVAVYNNTTVSTYDSCNYLIV